MGIFRGGNIVLDGLVFGYDADDRSTRFYPGEPTTNLVTSPTPNDNWGGYCGDFRYRTVNSMDVPAPDGTNTATKFTMPSSFSCGAGASWGAIFESGAIAPDNINTVSIYAKGSVGGEIFNFGINDAYMKSVMLTTKWVRYTATYTTSYTDNRTMQFTCSTPNATFYVWNSQVEEKYHATQFVNGSRSNTNSLIDLKRTSTIDLSNVAFDAYAQPTFNESNTNYFSISETLTQKPGLSFSYECWFIGKTIINNADKIVIGKSGCHGGLLYQDNSIQMRVWGPGTPCAGGNSNGNTSYVSIVGIPEHWVGTYENGVGVKLYKNGMLFVQKYHAWYKLF